MLQKMLYEYVSEDLVWYLIYVTYGVGFFSVLLAKYKLPLMLQYGKTLTLPRVGGHFSWYASLTVPRSYFTHFYTLSFLLSIINVCMFYRYLITWCICLHSLRRLLESVKVTVWGASSRMHYAHYFVGIWFYSALNLTVYLQLSEDAATSMASDHINKMLPGIGLVLFIIASCDQLLNHIHLAQLVKYSPPSRRLFKWVACAHYFDEVIIYISLALVGRTTRWSLTLASIWVLINLGVSSIETRRYYMSKFKSLPIAPYALIPFIL
ncbi:putative polyprenol reductase Ecym_4334 [Eremothecium cymbalariae DBVPG|uniref:Polyprenal reductase n=1 Tax=Eremothecium cymbalariae (strain CBS 270.75 / DBVPG 7215 / KCTC 17166 / NRRL Y-17582) TaxID=931890 RepID=G8JTP3_ERECY|nr:hypothetical protein Ecym_4334 [Eremothecium cymbalariae DBVPG\